MNLTGGRQIRTLRSIVGSLALIFVMVGLLWWLLPNFVSSQMRMPLLDGAGLSTQIADLASFFIVLGSCMLLGLYTKVRTWFYPPMMLLGVAAFGRILSWLFYDAALTLDMIAVEMVTILILLVLVQQFAAREKEKTNE